MKKQQRTGFMFEPVRQFSQSATDPGTTNYNAAECSHSDVRKDARLDSFAWCKYHNFDVMLTEIESNFCKENSCISSKLNGRSCYTMSDNFKKLCCDKDVLEIMLCCIKDGIGETLDSSVSNRMYRFASYRSFTYWIYGKLGRKKRRVIPACVVICIRKVFPDPKNQYKGFHDHESTID